MKLPKLEIGKENVMNIDDLTIGQAKELAGLFAHTSSGDGINSMLGKKVVIRTYSAGCWFGELSEKSGKEVIIKNARRLWGWKTKESISLSSVALHGVDQRESKIVEAVPEQWLEAIEITPCTVKAVRSIEGAPNVKAE